MRNLLLAACFVGCASIPAAHADTIRVPYIASDLTSEAGLERLYTQVEKAAKSVCRPESFMRPLSAFSSEAQCREDAVRDAIYKADAPALKAYYESAKSAENAVTRRETLASR